MDYETAKNNLNTKFNDDIQNFIEYREAGIYNGLEGCINYIQNTIGCDRNIAEEIIKNDVDLAPPDETPAEYEARVAMVNREYYASLNKPKCPICQSTNLSKISTVKKATKVGLFGIFGAGDIGKTWKCKNCGSRF